MEQLETKGQKTQLTRVQLDFEMFFRIERETIIYGNLKLK
jgi:hypothetical protein